MRRVKGQVAVGLLLVAACARIGEPPGGPPDSAAPVLIATVPDSTGIYPDFDDDAAFVFDETVSEGGSPNFGLGTGDLEKLVILSPSTEVPKVGWKRSRIAVKPREGWKPNRVYRIELLPGVMDLRNNRSRTGQIITFTTGAPLPGLVLRGRVVDWTTGRPEAQAVIEAVLSPDGDSLVYKSTTDSTGRFEFGPLPDGEYLVAGVLDQNKNRKRDGRESFDTVRVGVGRDSVGEIWAFRHDTVAARIQTLAVNDSMSIAVQFNQHLSPYQRLPADSVAVLQLPDSTTVPVVAILPKEPYDSLYAARPPSRPRGDSAAADSLPADSAAVAPPDTAAAAPPALPLEPPADTTERGPLKTKPLLFDRLLIRLDQPLQPGKRYRVEVRGVESVSGVRGDATQGLSVPERRPVPTDSTRADSTGARPDSTPPPTPPPPPPGT
ncbi:MAG: Ig-like domain-containing protein [Gemmatimonadales bacterium]